MKYDYDFPIARSTTSKNVKYPFNSRHGQGQRKSDARTIARGKISISTSSETEPRNQALIEWDDKGTYRKDDDSRIPADCDLIFGFIKMTVAHKVARH